MQNVWYVSKISLSLISPTGIGIIAGTAWIHLLPDSFEKFSSPCLDVWWQRYGTAWVGVFGLFAAFSVQLIEMAGHNHSKHEQLHMMDHGHDHHHSQHEEEEVGLEEGESHSQTHIIVQASHSHTNDAIAQISESTSLSPQIVGDPTHCDNHPTKVRENHTHLTPLSRPT
jgi:hypothetical protein